MDRIYEFPVASLSLLENETFWGSRTIEERTAILDDALKREITSTLEHYADGKINAEIARTMIVKYDQLITLGLFK